MRKRLLHILLFVVVGCVAGVAYIVTFQSDVLHTLAKNFIAGSLGPRITIQRVHIGLFPRPELELLGVGVSGPEPDTRMFQASAIRLRFNVFPSWQETVTPNRLMVENAHLDLVRDERGTWNYRSILQEGSSGGIGAWLAGASLDVVNGSLAVEDRYQRDGVVRVHANNVELQVERLVLDGPTDVFLSATLSERDTASALPPDGGAALSADGGSALSAYGTVDQIGGFPDVASAASSDAPPQLAMHVRVEFDRSTLVRTAELLRIDDVPAGWRGQTSAQGHIRFAPGARGYEMVASDLVVLADAVALSVDVNVTGLWHADPPTVSSQWTSTPVEIRHVSQLIPDDWLSPKLRDAIHRQAVQGKIHAVAATLSGSSHQDRGYALTGEFRVLDGALNFGPTWGKAEEIEGVVSMQSNGIRLSDFHGRYNHIPITAGTGAIAWRKEGPWLTTELLGDVSAMQAVDLAQKIFHWKNPRDPSDVFQGQAGRGMMTVRFAGPLQNPSYITFQDGEYRPERVMVRLPGWRRLFTHTTGVFTFSPQHFGFEEVTGLYGRSEFHVDGGITFGAQIFTDGLNVRGTMHVDDLLTLFPGQPMLSPAMVSGTGDYAVVVAGNLTTPTIRGGMDLLGVNVAMPGLLVKPPALAGRLDVKVRIGKNRHMSFEQMALSLPSVRLTGHGDIHYDRAPVVDVWLKTEPITVASLPTGLQLFDNVISEGTLTASVNLLGTERDWRTWNKSGWVTLTNGTINVGGVPPLSRVGLRARLHGHAAELTQLQWAIGDSRAQMTGIIHAWDSKPHLHVTLTAPMLDLESLMPKTRSSSLPLRATVEKIFQTATIDGHVQFERARYKALRFQTLTGRLRARDGMITVDHIQGTSATGTIHGRLSVRMPKERPASIHTWFDIRHMPLLALEQTFFDMATLEERLLTGMVSMKGMLEGRIGDARDMARTLNGRFRISIVDGHIKRGTVVPKILTILNLPSILRGQVDLLGDGYPFDRQTGTVTVANGILTSDDIVMRGPILNITAAGQYHVVNDDLNVVAAASPFGPYMDLLQKIPLFEMLLDSESEESVTAALFEITGPLREPQVTPMPLQSVTSGLTKFAKMAFTILKNTVTLPTKIFFPDARPFQSAPRTLDPTDDDEKF